VLVVVVTAAREFVWAKQRFQEQPSRLNADAQPVQPPHAAIPPTPEMEYALAVPRVKVLPFDQLLATLEQAIDKDDLPLVKALLDHGFLAYSWTEKLTEVIQRKMTVLGEKASENKCLIAVYRKTADIGYSSTFNAFQKTLENSSFLKSATAATDQERSQHLARTESQQTYLEIQALSPETLRAELVKDHPDLRRVEVLIEYRAKDLGPLDFAVAFLAVVRETNFLSFVRIDADRQRTQIDERLHKMLTGWLTQHPRFFQQETLAIELFHALLRKDLSRTETLFLEKASSNPQLHEVLNEMFDPQRETAYEMSPNGDNSASPADRIVGLDRTNLFHGKFASVNYQSLEDVLLPNSVSEITETSKKCSRFYSLLPVSSVLSWLKIKGEQAIKNELIQAIANAVPGFFETALCVATQDVLSMSEYQFSLETFTQLAKTMQKPGPLALAVIHKHSEIYTNFKNHFEKNPVAPSTTATTAASDQSKDEKQ